MSGNHYESDLESLSCNICFDLMMPPKKAPTLLFPCGHTFCKMCVERAAQENNKCPLCRTVIETRAPNISLQQMIAKISSRADDHKQLEQAHPQSETSQQKYLQQLSMYDTRCRVLTNRVVSLNTALVGVGKKANEAQIFLSHIKTLEMETAHKLASLEQELDLIRQSLRTRQNVNHELEIEKERLRGQLSMTVRTLSLLEKDREKCKLLLRSTQVPQQPHEI